MFYGKLSMAHLLLDEGAASFTMARVQENIMRRVSVMVKTYLKAYFYCPALVLETEMLLPHGCLTIVDLTK